MIAETKPPEDMKSKRKYKTYTPEERQALLDDLEKSNLTYEEFARQNGVSPASLYLWSKKGVHRPATTASTPAAKRYPLEDRQRILNEFKESGLSQIKFCKRSGVSVDSLRRWCNGVGLSTSPVAPKAKRYTPEQQQQLASDFRTAGLSQKEFCRQRGLSDVTLRKFLRRHGAAPAPAPSQHNGEPHSAPLLCPNCGCNLVNEFSKLAAKIQALASIKL